MAKKESSTNEEYPKRKYTKCVNSIYDPGSLVTWPQYLVEMIIQNRGEFIPKYKLNKGKNWWVPLGTEMGRLQMQAAHILSYFDSPEDDKIVAASIVRYVKVRKPTKMGTFKKFKNKATQDEKYFVKAIQMEINSFKSQMEKVKKTPVVVKEQPPKEEQKHKVGKNKWQKFQ